MRAQHHHPTIKSHLMLTAPAAMLTRIRGTKNGDTRRSLPSVISWPAASVSVVQPMPAPMQTPVAALSAGLVGHQPASASA
jgi:hypothetical protein